MKISNEFKVGLLAIIALAVLYMGFNYLKGTKVFSAQNEYYIMYDNVQGLVPSSPVHFNGLTVGMVEMLDLEPNSEKIICRLLVDDKVKLSKKSIAQIYSTGLITDKAINLIQNSGDYARGVIPKNQYAVSGDTLYGDVQMDITETVALEVRPVKEKAEIMMGSIDSILNVIKGVFDENTQQNITSSIGSIESTLGNFQITTSKLNTLIDAEKDRLSIIFGNVESITSSLAITNKEINKILEQNNSKITSVMNNADLVVGNVNDLLNSVDGIVANVDDITGNVASLEFQETIDQAQKTIADLDKIIAEINRGEGTLGLLLNDEQLYDNLNSTSSSLDNLLVDFKKNPKKYVQFSLIERKTKEEKELEKLQKQQDKMRP